MNTENQCRVCRGTYLDKYNRCKDCKKVLLEKHSKIIFECPERKKGTIKEPSLPKRKRIAWNKKTDEERAKTLAIWKEKNKESIIIKSKERYRRDREQYLYKAKMRNIEKHGLTIEEYEKFVIEQDNKCAICFQEFKKTPHIDHCHTTNKVRGLLCGPCNTAIGLLKENLETLLSAINYLQKRKA